MVFVVVLILLTLLNAYFSAIEIAMVSIRPFRIQQAADQGNVQAKKLLTILKDPEEYLSVIQVGITLIAIVEGFYGGEAFQQYLEPKLLQWEWPTWLAHGASLLVGIGSITYLTILFGELLPKTLALATPQKIALRFTPSFLVFTWLFYPLVQLLTWSTHILLRVFTSRSSESKKLTDADLKSVLSLAYRQGTIEEQELKLHENIFTFYDQRVSQIMTSFNKTVFIRETVTQEEINKIVRESPHNYFPVVRKNNQVIGILSAKDFLMSPDVALINLVHPACKVTSDVKTSDVLVRFQKASVNFSVVTGNNDELMGIVTMHDIGEALIGKFA